jgi:hypothetical protein
MVGPDYQKPDAPVVAEWIGPDNARVKRQPVAQTEWWKIFNDPVLNGLVDKAYQQNLTLQSAGLPSCKRGHSWGSLSVGPTRSCSRWEAATLMSSKAATACFL